MKRIKMAPKIPISLEGTNLGARHRYLNSLVNESYKSGDNIEDILNLGELSHVDRLYKIDLASKHKNVQYIVNNLQDNDMLFVSRALKSKWLLDEEHHQIINPSYLETTLYPHMLTTAINRMKNWIYLNLRDPVRCHEFYQYYLEKESEYAIKFLRKCHKEIILTEFMKKATLDKITPQLLKVLCEKAPAVSKMFYDIVSIKGNARPYNMRRDENKYLDSIKCVLKKDPDTFLDIIEKYFTSQLKKLSANATKFILTQRKDRFIHKAELYTVYVLHVSTIAQCLSQEECQEIVVRLARAHYLSSWFSYRNVEPFVKRLDVGKRASFKKKIFVDKKFGDMVLKCPYDVPKNLAYFSVNDNLDSEIPDIYGNVDLQYQNNVFLYEYESNTKYDYIGEDGYMALESCMSLCRADLCFANSARCLMLKKKTGLDLLFDQYRYTSFFKALFELRLKIQSESSPQNRMHMFLVLVSKSGGTTENLRALFNLLALHKNEPSHVRAAIVRSLVVRVSIWRSPNDIWDDFLVFGHGLGLDGSVPEADCVEGMHAAVIRSLLSENECEPALKTAFMKQFSTFHEYALSVKEKTQIKNILLKMLVSNANLEKDTKTVTQILKQAIDVLQKYKIKFSTQTELIAVIKNLIKNDIKASECLMLRLFNSKLGRKELFKENFEIIQTDASYMNALKHDINIISFEKILKSISIDNMKAEHFIKKISVYFMKKEDITREFLVAFKDAKNNNQFARHIAYLSGKELLPYILELDIKDDNSKRFAARIRANSHVARPVLNINDLEWKIAGVKFIANRVVSCKSTDLDNLIKNLLAWKNTARLATVLAPRTNYGADIYAAAAKMRPTATLKSALSYFRLQKNQSDPLIWNVVKPLMANIKSIKSSPHLLCNIRNVDSIPPIIQSEYLVEAYKIVADVDFNKSLGILSRIKNVTSKVEPTFIEEVLTHYLENRLILEKIPTASYDYFHTVVKLHLDVLAKYLLFSKTEEIQNGKFKKVGQIYLDRLQSYWESRKDKKIFFEYVNAFTTSLRNTEVFTNEEYVSSLPVMDNVVQWLRSVVPIEENIKLIVPLHLNMLYFTAIRQTGALKPGIFDNVQSHDEAYKIVGETFGKLIVQNARVLAKGYFDSIIVLYGIGLINFCTNYNNNKWNIVVPYIIKSIVEESDGFECTLGLQLYDTIRNKYWIKKSVKEDIYNCFKQKDDIEMQFFFGDCVRPE